MRRPLSWISIFCGLAVLVSSAAGQYRDDSELQQGELKVIGDLLNAGEFDQVAERALAELSRLEVASPIDSLRVAKVLELLVESRWRSFQVQGEELDQWAERSLRLREALHGPDSPRIHISVVNLGILHWRRGNYALAREHLTRNVGLLVDTPPENEATLGTALNNLALVLWSLGELDEAQERMERSVEILERHYGEDHPFVAQTLDNLGLIATDAGDYPTARRILERARILGRGSLGKAHPEFARILQANGYLLWLLGDYVDALPVIEESLRIREQLLGENHPDVAWSLGSLTNVLRDMGDLERARAVQERAIAIREAALGPDHPDLANDLLALAKFSRMAGHPAEATQLSTRGLRLLEDSGVTGISRARAHVGLALSLAGEARWEEAQGTLDEGLALWSAHPGHPEQVKALELQGMLRLRAGRFAEADEPLRGALEIAEATVGGQHPETAWICQLMSVAALGDGDVERSLDLALRSEKISREHLREVSIRLEQQRALDYAQIRVPGLDVALSTLLVQPNAEGLEQVVDALVRSRALVLDEVARRHLATRHTLDPKTQELWRQLDVATSRLSNLLVRGRDSSGNYDQILRLAMEERNATERSLAERSETYRRARNQSRAGYSDVVQALGPREALVSFVRFSRMTMTGESLFDTEPWYAAIVTRGDGTSPRLCDLGPASALDQSVEEWWEEAARGEFDRTRSSRNAESAVRARGFDLADRIWTPLEPWLGAVDRVYVVLAGPLHFVNIAALPSGADAYLVESPLLVQTLSAERDLVSAESVTPGRGLLAVGGVAYDGSAVDSVGLQVAFRGAGTDCAELGDLRFEPLPASVGEITAIGTSFREAGLGRDVLQLTGLDASESRFKASAPGRRIVHIATHGFFFDASCRGLLGRTQAMDNPLVRSGLALAGANLRETAAADAEDGVLTAQEIASLDLRGVELAVLSACDTGLGRLHDGEGVLGLRRSFLLAGARSLVMSLWAVDDEMSRQWMTRLYRGDTRDAAAAVRDAMRSVLRERRASGQTTHPYYWGGFVAVGR